MKVYVITAGEYSDYCIQAVTLNREKAELICAINNRNIRYSEDRSKIEEYDRQSIAIRTADSSIVVGWNASQEDILAEDWVFAE